MHLHYLLKEGLFLQENKKSIFVKIRQKLMKDQNYKIELSKFKKARHPKRTGVLGLSPNGDNLLYCNKMLSCKKKQCLLIKSPFKNKFFFTQKKRNRSGSESISHSWWRCKSW